MELPYLDRLLLHLRNNNPTIEQIAGFHIHAGYWEDPGRCETDLASFPFALQALVEQFLAHVMIEPGQAILDVGCGFGGTISYLNDHYHNLRLVGLNIDQRQIDRAIQLVTPRNGNRIEWIVADAMALPFSNSEFDIILALESVMHFSSKLAFFLKAAQILKHTGQMTISDYLSSSLKLPVLAAISLLYWNDLQKVYGPHGSIPTIQTYRQLAKRTELHISNDRDITKHILPTFQIYSLAAEEETKEWKRSFIRVNKFFRLCTSLRLETYRILTFHRLHPLK